jgi:acylphosphatase
MNEEKEGNICLYAIVEGRVQGVGFRYFVQEKAITLGLTGWVRNRWNGSVEVNAEGDKQDLEKLYTALLRGPRSANVTNIKHQWLAAKGEHSHFNIRMTA